MIWAGCSEDLAEQTCSTPATVVDLSGLDGCGFVFQLEDGTRLVANFAATERHAGGIRLPSRSVSAIVDGKPARLFRA